MTRTETTHLHPTWCGECGKQDQQISDDGFTLCCDGIPCRGNPRLMDQWVTTKGRSFADMEPVGEVTACCRPWAAKLAAPLYASHIAFTPYKQPAKTE